MARWLLELQYSIEIHINAMSNYWADVLSWNPSHFNAADIKNLTKPTSKCIRSENQSGQNFQKLQEDRHSTVTDPALQKICTQLHREPLQPTINTDWCMMYCTVSRTVKQLFWSLRCQAVYRRKSLNTCTIVQSFHALTSASIKSIENATLQILRIN